MAGGEEDASVRLVLADHVGCGGSRENGVVSDDELGDTVGRADSENSLHGLWREETTVTADDEGLSLSIDGVENGLDEVLCVVLVRETGQTAGITDDVASIPPAGRS